MIITDESKLRAPCTNAGLNEVIEIITKLEGELDHSFEIGKPGIGLSAIQIGIQKNVAIVRISTGTGIFYNVNLVNCRIAEGYDKSEFIGEGCLSFPNLIVTTSRYREIKVVENLMEPQKFVATGLFAVCIQHELDHLKGILLPDLALKRQV